MTEILTYEDPVGGARGWLVYDGSASPLAAGGCRMRPGLTAGELSELAGRMTLKQRVLGLNVDGAKCGLDHDPRAGDAERVLEGFLTFLRDELHHRFSMGSDMGTDWNQLQRLAAGNNIPSVKYAIRRAQGLTDEEFSTRMARLDDRVGMLKLSRRRAGHALTHAAIGAARAAGVTGRISVALQGFGTLGRAAAHGFLDEGIRVVAVADEHGCVVDPAGLDLTRMLHSPPGTPVPRMDVAGTRLPGGALFEMPADVLTLAAGADAVSAGHAAAPVCPAVAVGANCGLSESAEGTLHDRGVLVVPDFIGGIGGSASMEALFGPPAAPTAPEVLTSVAHLARRLVDDLFSTARRHGEPPRQAALRLADRTGADPGSPPYGHSPYLTHSGV